MDFREAEDRFRMLEDQRARGVLSEAQYRAELDQLRVTDARGRLWMLQERTGHWYVFENNQWIAGRPPVEATPSPGTAPRPPQTEPEKGGGCGKMILYLAIWGVVWVVVAVVVYLLWGREEPMVLAGVGLAALISLVFLLGSLSSAWSGTIVDMRVKTVRSTDEDGYTRSEDVLYAYVQRPNGKMKTVRAHPDWEVGDRLEKRRGEAHTRHYPSH